MFDCSSASKGVMPFSHSDALSADFFGLLSTYRERTKYHKSQEKLRRAMTLVAEGDEDRTKWLRLAAAILVQMSIRRISHGSMAAARTRPYLRDDWVEPTAEERSKRCTNVMKRFPMVPEETVQDLMLRCRGHAGYVVAALQPEHGRRDEAGVDLDL